MLSRAARSCFPARSHRGLTKQLQRCISRSTRQQASNVEFLKQEQVIFSGIQPTGVPHLGNYLGALRNWVRLQNETPDDVAKLFCIVDLHAITIPQDPAQLEQWRKEVMISFLAIGLDPEKSTLFYQSSVAAHSELMWILNTQASIGNLSRMTQYKSKARTQETSSSGQELKLGLLAYPVLQAADVLLYRTTHVPVGEDQSQHLEFARTCANAFNSTYPARDNAGPVFVPPETILSSAKRVMSLNDPTKKMSKSNPSPASRILINDPSATITKKINSAVTDSTNSVTYDREARPGVSNLVDILFHINEASGQQEASSPQELAEQDLNGISLKALKERVGKAVDEHLTPVRDRYEQLIAEDGAKDITTFERAAWEGEEQAMNRAAATMRRVREAMGLGEI